MRTWEVIWHSGRRETFQAADYREARRKALNRVNWRDLGPVFKIGLIE